MIKLSNIKLRWSIHSIFLLLLLISNVSTTYGIAIDEETQQDRKTLYLHVGTHKTGTSTIQEECTRNRLRLRQSGLLYPESFIPETNHHSLVHRIQSGYREVVNDYIRGIEEQSNEHNCNSVLLSSEAFSYMWMDNEFEPFLKSLRQHFRVNIVYVDRDFKDRVASLASWLLAFTGNKGLVEFYSADKSIDDFIKKAQIKQEEGKRFFADQGANFFSFEELIKGKKLVQTFLRQTANVDIEIPNSYCNTMEQLPWTKRSDDDLRETEIFFGVPAGTFVMAWEQSQTDGVASFYKLIANITKKRALELFEMPAPQSSLSSSSSSTPAVPVLELEASDFHMGKVSPYPSSGFSIREGTHRWTEGEKATMIIPLKDMEHRPSHVSFLNTKALVTGGHPQRLIVKVNGKEVKSYDYTLSKNNQTIEVPLPEDEDQAIIEFETPDAISLLALRAGLDKRILGVSFREVQFR